MPQYHVAKRGIGEVSVAVVRTDRDEIDSIAEIVLRGKADTFSVEWHREKNSKRRCRASRQKPSGPPETGGKPGATKSRGSGAQRDS